MKILAVLSQFPDGCTAGRLTLLSGYLNSGAIRNTLSELRSAGCLEGDNGGVMTITAAGEAHGPFPELPSGRALLDYWLRHPSFGKAPRAILQALADGDSMTAEQLARATGYEYSGGFRNALSELRTAGVLTGSNTGDMRISGDRAVTERPILFSSPMIRAILAGHKTQTRRIVKVGHRSLLDRMANMNGAMRCRYGQPGHRLWVRELCRAEELTTKLAAEYDKLPGQDGVRYLADNAWRSIENSREASDRWVKLNCYRGKRGATVEAIHMPRWACRIVLEITDCRHERLHAITESDAEAEGCRVASTIPTARDAYRLLWDDINGPGSWSLNPYVWAITFKVLEH